MKKSKDLQIAELLKNNSGIRLDIGCGANKQPHFVGMDIQPLPGVDIVHDWNIHPWPLPNECAIMAMASHVIEHVPKVIIDGGKTRLPFIEFMDEVWRILKPDAEFAIACPHGSSQGFLQDPTHCNPLNEATFAYFDPLEPNTNGLLYNFYRPKPWRIKYLSWSPAANIEVILCKRRIDKSYGLEG